MNEKTRHAQASIRIATIIRNAAEHDQTVPWMLKQIANDDVVKAYRTQPDEAKKTRPILAIDLLRAIDTIIDDVFEEDEAKS